MLVVLTSGRGRVNGAAFAVGFVTGQALFFLLVFSLGTLANPNRDNHPTVIAILVIAFGASLLATAVYVRRHRIEPALARGPSPRAEAIHSRLSRLRPLSALGAGAALGAGGPKRLSITIIATATITASGLGNAGALGLALLYVGVSTVLVWVPVTLYIMWGARAAEWLGSAEHWMGRHKVPLTVYPSAVLGLVLVVDGVVQLVG